MTCVLCLRLIGLGLLRRFRLVGVRGLLLVRRGVLRVVSCPLGIHILCTRVRIVLGLVCATWRMRVWICVYRAYVPVHILAITGIGKPLARASRVSTQRLWVSGLQVWQGAVGPSVSRHPL